MMSTDIRPSSYPLRLEPETRVKLEAIAKANGRSLNAEIVIRLEASLLNEPPPPDNELEATIRRIVREELAKAGKV